MIYSRNLSKTPLARGFDWNRAAILHAVCYIKRLNESNMSDSQIILYDGDGAIKIQVLLDNESVWLTLNQIAELFDRDKSTISKHIKNIFETGELKESSTVAKNATVQNEGGRTVNRSWVEAKSKMRERKSIR